MKIPQMIVSYSSSKEKQRVLDFFIPEYTIQSTPFVKKHWEASRIRVDAANSEHTSESLGRALWYIQRQTSQESSNNGRFLIHYARVNAEYCKEVVIQCSI